MDNSHDQNFLKSFDHEFVQVSKNTIVLFILFILVMTALLMSVFTFMDFESILGTENLAMKVGETSISFNDLSEIKKNSGADARTLSDLAFSADLFESLLLAENARKLGLNKTPEFRSKYESFKNSLKLKKDIRNIALTSFEIEELARASISEMLKNNREYQQKLISPAPKAKSIPEASLHLRTILVANASDAAAVETASNTDFLLLNASYSKSLYKPVNGDLGIKTRKDLPDGVFDLLLRTGIGRLVRGYQDDSGIHFFEVVSKIEPDMEKHNQALKKKQIQTLKKRLIRQHINKLENETDYWVNPVLRSARHFSNGQSLKE